MRRVLRGVVPVDDQVHVLAGADCVVYVGTRHEDAVEVWWLLDSEAPAGDLRVSVFGTGHLVPDDAEYLGTAVTPSGRLVWHLFEVGDVGG